MIDATLALTAVTPGLPVNAGDGARGAPGGDEAALFSLALSAAGADADALVAADAAPALLEGADEPAPSPQETDSLLGAQGAVADIAAMLASLRQAGPPSLPGPPEQATPAGVSSAVSAASSRGEQSIADALDLSTQAPADRPRSARGATGAGEPFTHSRDVRQTQDRTQSVPQGLILGEPAASNPVVSPQDPARSRDRPDDEIDAAAKATASTAGTTPLEPQALPMAAPAATPDAARDAVPARDATPSTKPALTRTADAPTQAVQPAAVTADAAITGAGRKGGTEPPPQTKVEPAQDVAAPLQRSEHAAPGAGPLPLVPQSMVPGSSTAAAAPTAPTPSFQGQLSAAVGSGEFAPALGVQVSMLVRNGIPEARLHVAPAELGPIAVQIELTGQSAQINLSAEHAFTRQALEQAMPQLAAALRDAGLTLTGGGVFQQPRESAGQAPVPGRGGAAPARDEPEDLALPLLTTRARVQRGAVDLYA